MPWPSQMTKQKELQHLTASMSWLTGQHPAQDHPYELLRLSKSTREALREALADAEVFMARIPAEPQEEDKEDCLHTSQHAP